MITTTDTSALLTFVNSNRQGRLLPVAAFATILARVSWINSFKHTPGAFSLGLCHPEKVPPGNIADRLREMVVFQHPANVQILDRDRVKSSDKVGRYLVVKIIATARYFQVRLGDSDSLLRASLRSFLSARKPPSLSLQVVESVLEMARILDLFAGRERGETGYPGIHANDLSGRRRRGRFRYLENNQSIPAVNAACASQIIISSTCSIARRRLMLNSLFLLIPFTLQMFCIEVDEFYWVCPTKLTGISAKVLLRKRLVDFFRTPADSWERIQPL